MSLTEETWFYPWVADPLEKAGKTFVQVFLVIWIGTGAGALNFDHQIWTKALLPSLYSAAASLLLTYALLLAGVSVLSGWLDVIVRAVKTFIQTYIGILGVTAGGQVPYDTSLWKVGLGAAVSAAVLSVVTSMIGLLSPHTIGGSWVPTDVSTHTHSEQSLEEVQQTPRHSHR